MWQRPQYQRWAKPAITNAIWPLTFRQEYEGTSLVSLNGRAIVKTKPSGR